jgi:hypothetical protein
MSHLNTKNILIRLLFAGAISISIPMSTQAKVSEKAKAIWGKIEKDQTGFKGALQGISARGAAPHGMTLDEAIELALGYFQSKMTHHEPHEALSNSEWDKACAKYNHYFGECVHFLSQLNKLRPQVSHEVAQLIDQVIRDVKPIESINVQTPGIDEVKRILELLKQENFFKVMINSPHTHESAPLQKPTVSESRSPEVTSNHGHLSSAAMDTQPSQPEASSDDEFVRGGSKKSKKRMIDSDTELASPPDESEDAEVYRLNLPRHEHNKRAPGVGFDKVPERAKQRMRELYHEIGTSGKPQWAEISRRLTDEGLNYTGKAIAHRMTAEGVHRPAAYNEWTKEEQDLLQQLTLEKKPANFSEFSREIANQFPGREAGAIYKQLIKHRKPFAAQEAPWLTVARFNEQERKIIESAYNKEATAARELGVNIISKRALAEKLAKSLEGRTVPSLEAFLIPYYETKAKEGVGAHYSQKENDTLIAAYQEACLNHPAGKMVLKKDLAKEIHQKGLLLGRTERAIQVQLRAILKAKKVKWGDPWPEEGAAEDSEGYDEAREEADDEEDA